MRVVVTHIGNNQLIDMYSLSLNCDPRLENFRSER